MKAWSYRQITEKTESQLQSFAQLASETNERAQVHVYRCMANGAFALWREVTSGWQTDGSAKRLEALCDQVGQRPTVQELDSMARFSRRSYSSPQPTPKQP